MPDKWLHIHEWIQPDNTLMCHSQYICWEGEGSNITLDGSFSLEELEEVVRYIKEYNQSRITTSSKRWDGRPQ